MFKDLVYYLLLYKGTVLGTEEQLSENVHDVISSVCAGVFSVSVSVRGGSRQLGAYSMPGIVFVTRGPALNDL